MIMLRILRRPEVEAITGLRRTRLDELERKGEFPKRVRISERATGWRSDELDAWVESRPRAADVDADMSEQLRATDLAAKRRGSAVRAERARERGTP
jgi:prophage regulatory protein